MRSVTLDQAVREAIESERAAARCFDALATREMSPAARDLCRYFAAQEQCAADRLESLARRLAGPLAHYADLQVETALPPSFASEGASALDALRAVRSSTYRMALLYDALGDASPTHSPLFRELAGSQAELATRLDRMMRVSMGKRAEDATEAR